MGFVKKRYEDCVNEIVDNLIKETQSDDWEDWGFINEEDCNEWIHKEAMKIF